MIHGILAGMRNFLTLLVCVGLLAASAFTAWVFISLSGNVEFSRQEPGAAAEVRVP